MEKSKLKYHNSKNFNITKNDTNKECENKFYIELEKVRDSWQVNKNLESTIKKENFQAENSKVKKLLNIELDELLNNENLNKEFKYNKNSSLEIEKILVENLSSLSKKLAKNVRNQNKLDVQVINDNLLNNSNESKVYNKSDSIQNIQSSQVIGRNNSKLSLNSDVSNDLDGIKRNTAIYGFNQKEENISNIMLIEENKKLKALVEELKDKLNTKEQNNHNNQFDEIKNEVLRLNLKIVQLEEDNSNLKRMLNSKHSKNISNISTNQHSHIENNVKNTITDNQSNPSHHNNSNNNSLPNKEERKLIENSMGISLNQVHAKSDRKIEQLLKMQMNCMQEMLEVIQKRNLTENSITPNQLVNSVSLIFIKIDVDKEKIDKISDRIKYKADNLDKIVEDELMEYSAINEKRQIYDLENNAFQLQENNIESNSNNLKRNIKTKDNYNKFISFNNNNEISYDGEGKLF